MYKSLKKGKFYIAFHKFPKTAKEVSEVYKTGFHVGDHAEFKSYYFVIGVFRIIVSIDKSNTCCEAR